jgi:hypothetical protein
VEKIISLPASDGATINSDDYPIFRLYSCESSTFTEAYILDKNQNSVVENIIDVSLNQFETYETEDKQSFSLDSGDYKLVIKSSKNGVKEYKNRSFKVG